MTVIPPPVDFDWDNATEGAYYAHVEAMENYLFKTRWLEIALTPAEFKATLPVAIPLLIDMYPDIRAEGPMGAAWYGQLRQMRQILHGKVKTIDPEAFLNDFITTYLYMTASYAPNNTIWDKLKAVTTADCTTNALYPDVDSYNAGPPVEVFDAKLLRKLDRLRDERLEQFGDALDDHARIALLSYIIPGLGIKQMDDTLAKHTAFLARYNLSR